MILYIYAKLCFNISIMGGICDSDKHFVLTDVSLT